MKNKESKNSIRVRFAPSPTGFLHIGAARTALFNYLFAEQKDGIFILRIEDTDQERSKPKFEKDIKQSLRWLGLKWDEFYRQSERLDLYEKYLRQLLEQDRAYYCFCSEEELKAHREYALSAGKPPVYSKKCANLSEKKVKENLEQGKDFVIRFRVPARKVKFKDLVRGKVEFDTSLIGDFAIARSFSSPLYNFAAAVDDFKMNISHVIRGEEHISNTPKQILLQETLDFPHPKYAHLPLILGPDRSKLSKRHGATSVIEFKKQGYLPQALVNFMAFLGWNPGTEREIYSLSSLVQDFSLDRVQKGGAVLNTKRLNWVNGFYIRQKSAEKLTRLCLPFLIKADLIQPINNGELGNPNPEELRLFKEKPQFKIKATGEPIKTSKLIKIVKLYQTRIKKLSDISSECDFFFKEKLSYEKQLLQWKEMTDSEILKALDLAKKTLSELEVWNRENIRKTLMAEAEKREDRGEVLWPVRAALTGKEGSAGPFAVAALLGKKKTLKRLREAQEMIGD